MKTYLDCIPCFFRQGLNAARLAGLTEEQQKMVLDSISKIIPDIPMEASPPEIAREIYRVIRESCGMDDPFRLAKDEHIDFAMKLLPELRGIADRASDPLLEAVIISVAGNVIDFGANPDFNIEGILAEIEERDFSIFDYSPFREDIGNAEKILFIGDNAGETVFDRILLEKIKGKIVYAVRERPIINDATLEDAKLSGIDRNANIISSGCDAPGTILKYCNDEFIHSFRESDIVISKGQGNYETLSDADRELYFLLKVKCPVIADDIGVTSGSYVLMRKEA